MKISLLWSQDKQIESKILVTPAISVISHSEALECILILT